MTAPTDTLPLFDAAVAAELPRVSHLHYDSHEICKHFAGKLRKQIAAMAAQHSAPSAEPQSECDSPRLCAVQRACLGQYGTQKKCSAPQAAESATASVAGMAPSAEQHLRAVTHHYRQMHNWRLRYQCEAPEPRAERKEALHRTALALSMSEAEKFLDSARPAAQPPSAPLPSVPAEPWGYATKAYGWGLVSKAVYESILASHGPEWAVKLYTSAPQAQAAPPAAQGEPKPPAGQGEQTP